MRAVLAWGVVASVGVIILGLGIGLGFGLFPVLIANKVADNLDLWNPDSEGRKNFEMPPVDIFMKFMIYHVTNPYEVISTGAKPVVEERGPYAYKEIREKISVTDESYSRDTIQFGQYKAYVFSKEHSCEGCDKDDKVTVINAPLVGFVYKLTNMGGLGKIYLKQLEAAITGDTYKDTLFMDVTVDGFLFNGVIPGTVEFIFSKWSVFGRFMPYLIQRENGFAAFNTKNATAHNEYYRIKTGADDTMDDYFSIVGWGRENDTISSNLTEANWWNENGGYNGSNACNDLRGTDGQQFAPDVKDKDRLYIFQTDLCRSIFIEYKNDEDIDGIKAVRYVPPPMALQVNTTTNIGFCMQIEDKVDWDACLNKTDNEEILNLDECFKDPNYGGSCHDGTLDISKCMEDSPVVMSSPHFYQSPKLLHDAIGNLSQPDPENDETRIDIEPVTGMAIRLHKKIQVNLPVKPNDIVTCLNNVTSFLMPMLYVDEGADIDQENIDKLKEMVTTPLKILDGVKWALIVVGLLIFVLGSVKLYLIRH